jgi:hypothetical protein
MGSRLTEDRKAMRLILGAIKERGIFFLDSYTTPRSVVLEVAKELGLPTATRHVFLDHIPNDANYVADQIEKLISAAKKHKEAVGIGHPRRSTLEALRQHLPRLTEEGIRLVPISALLKARVD